jgi:hypothetical protein
LLKLHIALREFPIFPSTSLQYGDTVSVSYTLVLKPPPLGQSLKVGILEVLRKLDDAPWLRRVSEEVRHPFGG